MARKQTESQEYKAFLKDISEGTLKSLYIFHGEEHYLMERYMEKIRKQLIPDGLEEFNHRRFEGQGLTASVIADAVDMLPVFSERTLVEIHDYDIFKANEADRKMLSALFADIPDYVCLIFIYDTLEFKPDKRLKDTKEMLKNISEVEFALQDGEKITRWICKHFKEGGKYIAPPDAEYLAFITGGQMTALNTEIEKLCSFSSESAISRTDIDACVMPVADAVTYKLANAVAGGEYTSAVTMLSDLIRMREPAHKILFSLSMTMRQLLFAKLAIEEGKNTRYLMDTYGIRYDFQAKNLMNNAKKLSVEMCRKAVLLCSETALSLNSGADAEAAMTELVASICFYRKAV